ncbi:hypothetical protein GF339_06860 [candidate division KSB3 bacterium]|uniref:Uncharacterized protein n=1 Tax=candidate division KSB3 bacterium TaxID=2044937 RepID=A0A9D5JU53_9BACT|nr:hypothetical protein [candidate division KSB3 bacterium]MBD3324287.1 hypothetical protein [candidate division KSB3 bacterium]
MNITDTLIHTLKGRSQRSNLCEIPPFKEYYPSIKNMSPQQRTFYRYLEKELSHHRYPPVDGNISYLFVYTYNIINQWEKKGLEYIYLALVELAEAYYYEKKFADYCNCWSYDCLLALKHYEDYLVVSEPEDIFSVNGQLGNMRCNVSYYLHRPVKAIDLLVMLGGKITRYTKSHATAFRDFLETSFAEDTERHGPWLQRLLSAQKSAQTYEHMFFTGVPVNTQLELSIPYYCFYAAYTLHDNFQELIRTAENRLREAHNMPKVGEGWVSETELYYALKQAFPQTQVVQHGHPEWLGKQHLDIWFPRWKIAVEYHGTQHFEPVEIFGGEQGFAAVQERDERKLRLCTENNVVLIVATERDSHDDVIQQVKQAYSSNTKL